jgi:EF hand domain-containing protein
MQLRLPVVLLTALALAAPGAIADAKDKVNKDKKEQRSDDRRHDDDRDRDDRDGDRDRDHRDDDRDGKRTICHIPPGNRAARHTISVGDSAWAAHQGHGDTRGACGHGTNNQDRRFNDLDRNDNGVISAGEWRGDRATFDRLDRNNDGVLSRREFFRS